MPTYLIVANQTVGGGELGRAIRDRITRGDAVFRVVVPLVAPIEESVWTAVDPWFGVPAMPPATTAAIEEGRQRSQRRLDQLLAAIRTAGAPADGHLGAPDPYEATVQALAEVDAEEVIVSTLPAGISRWIKMDLVSRLQRATDVPVTPIEASGRESPTG